MMLWNEWKYEGNYNSACEHTNNVFFNSVCYVNVETGGITEQIKHEGLQFVCTHRTELDNAVGVYI